MILAGPVVLERIFGVKRFLDAMSDFADIQLPLRSFLRVCVCVYMSDVVLNRIRLHFRPPQPAVSQSCHLSVIECKCSDQEAEVDRVARLDFTKPKTPFP